MKKPSGPITYTISKGADVWPFRARRYAPDGAVFSVYEAVALVCGCVALLAFAAGVWVGRLLGG